MGSVIQGSGKHRRVKPNNAIRFGRDPLGMANAKKFGKPQAKIGKKK